MAQSAVVKALAAASRGLQFVSETDAGFKAFEWKAAADDLTPAVLLTLAKQPPGTAVDQTTLEEFFRAVPVDDRPAFDKLAAALREQLTDVRVYKVGEVNMDVYVVGRTRAGALAGLKTQVVET